MDGGVSDIFDDKAMDKLEDLKRTNSQDFYAQLESKFRIIRDMDERDVIIAWQILNTMKNLFSDKFGRKRDGSDKLIIIKHFKSAVESQMRNICSSQDIGMNGYLAVASKRRRFSQVIGGILDMY